MIRSPRLRKFALTVHVASSVGWLGSVVGFLALAVAGLTIQDAQTMRGAYIAMELTARYNYDGIIYCQVWTIPLLHIVDEKLFATLP